jgi:hypothetical protein
MLSAPEHAENKPKTTAALDRAMPNADPDAGWRLTEYIKATGGRPMTPPVDGGHFGEGWNAVLGQSRRRYQRDFDGAKSGASRR